MIPDMEPIINNQYHKNLSFQYQAIFIQPNMDINNMNPMITQDAKDYNDTNPWNWTLFNKIELSNWQTDHMHQLINFSLILKTKWQPWRIMWLVLVHFSFLHLVRLFWKNLLRVRLFLLLLNGSLFPFLLSVFSPLEFFFSFSGAATPFPFLIIFFSTFLTCGYQSFP